MMLSALRSTTPRRLLLQRRRIHASQRTCPSCSQPLPSPLPVCNKCWHISRLPQDTKFHEIFGLPYQPNPFVINVSVLKQRFRDVQAVCHPDSWASKGSDKQDIAQALSSRVNEAYSCLLKPLSRAEYILARQHIPISEKDKVDDVDFMSEIMEARETIAEAHEEDDVSGLVEENCAKIKETIGELETLIGEGQWQAAKAAAVRLRYLEGIERAGNRWLENRP